MNSFNFSAPKLMTSLCLLLFVFLAATGLQAQPTSKFALWEVDDNGEPKFKIYNIGTKQYYRSVSENPTNAIGSKETMLKKINNGEYYQIGGGQYTWDANDNRLTQEIHNMGTSDDWKFEEVKTQQYPKDVFRIKNRKMGTYLTASPNEGMYVTHIDMGDRQLWMLANN